MSADIHPYFMTSSPQGDGNIICYAILSTVEDNLFHDLFPARGRKQRLYLAIAHLPVVDFMTSSPQGDGNNFS